MTGRRQQQGVALAMLLWMVAGLSLLVSGTMYLARTDVQLTAFQMDQAKAQAAARGVAQLLMRDMLAARQPLDAEAEQADITVPAVFSRQYAFSGMEIYARAIPSSGFIHLNSAPPELLANLFHYGGGLPLADAQDLASRVEEWRMGGAVQESRFSSLEQAPGLSSNRFTVLEDLLRVPGMSRQIYDRISPALYVGTGSSMGVNPTVAGPLALMAASAGDQDLVDFMQESRQDEPPGGTRTGSGMESPYLTEDSSSSYCLEIDVMLSANRTFRQRIWVDTDSGSGALPWQFTRVMPIVMRPSAQLNDQNGAANAR